MIEIRDDQEIPTDDFNALLKELGFRTQDEARKALGVTQAYISQLKNGVRTVQPHTSLHKLLQALRRIRALERGGAAASG
jgi:predicted transcriptional regulator